MSDNWPEAVRYWEDWADAIPHADRVTPGEVARMADAAIAALKEMVDGEYRRGFRAAQGQADHDIRQAEVEVERLKEMVRQRQSARDDLVVEKEAEVERLKWMLEWCYDYVEVDVDRPPLDDWMADLAARYEKEHKS